MKRWLHWVFLPVLVLVFFLCNSAFSQALPSVIDVLLNERLTLAPGIERTYVFSPTANNLYTFRSFGAGTAKAALYLQGEEQPIASAEGFSLDVRLIADATYRLVVEAQSGAVEIEMMRAALGRSFEQPIELTDLAAGYDKAIPRAYDTHWYRFTAPVSGMYVIRSTSQINTVGYLISEAGERIALSDNLYSPYCLDFRIQHALEAGKTYYVRVSGRGGETGTYHLTIAQPEPDEPALTALSISAERIALREGDTQLLQYTVSPSGAQRDAVWVSSAPEVASVDQTGLVTAQSAGQADIILSGTGNVEARLTVAVEAIHVSSVSVKEEVISMNAGQALKLEYDILPANASDKRVIVESSDPSVVAVERRELLTAVGPGEADITVTTRDGSFSSIARVVVGRALSNYRALAIGVSRYQDGRVRTGAVNTTQGVGDLFSRQNYGDSACDVTVRLDTTRSEAIAAIHRAFMSAVETDVSILYVNGHGGVTNGQAWLEFSDGGKLTAAQLERITREIKGMVVLLIDCCQSGGFLTTDAARDFSGRMISAFTSGVSSRLARTKYRILTSTSAVEDSYRMSADGSRVESAMTTAFSRGLAEAGGWDLIGDKASRMRADINKDQLVTLHEAYLYVRGRVNGYLAEDKQRRTQSVQIYPEGSQFVLFERS